MISDPALAPDRALLQEYARSAMRVRDWVRPVAALVVVLLGIQTCWAQKVTVDPNAGPAVQETAAKTDSRLAQRLSYETWHMPLKTILADLSEQTGVTLNSGYNKQDWQVRDRRMSILVEDVSLAELMNSIARVMKFKWSVSEQAMPPTYRLVADRRLIATFQTEATRRENELGLKVSRRRAAVADAMDRLSTASDAEMQGLRETDPYSYMSAETGFAKLMAQLFKEKPGLREAYIGGNKNVKIPYAELSPQSQQLFTDVLKSNWKYHKLHGGSQKLQDSLDQELPKLNIHMGRVHAGEPELHTKICPKISDEARKAISERVKSEGHGVEPRLMYEAAENAIAAAAGLGIVSDSFNAVSGEYSLQGNETELGTLLDGFCKSFCCNWAKQGSILELRRRDWFRRRASQVPDEWLQPWREQLRSTGTMDLDSFLRMATLTQEQKQENIDTDKLLSEALGVRWEINDHEGMMRFYLRLSPAQRSMLFSGGLDPRSLNPEQWQRYREMFHYGRKYTWGTEVFSEAAGGQALVTASSAFANGRREYYFRVTLDDEGKIQEQSFHVYLPSLQPSEDVSR